jgi:hypothetical protein
MENIDYVGTKPDIAMCGNSQTSDSERRECLERCEVQKGMPIDNKRVLESYCQDDVTVVRQSCHLFRREFLNIAKIDAFQESLTIASACNNLFRKLFLHPDSIGLIRPGDYIGSGLYSKKSITWMRYKEQTDGCSVIHGRNIREVWLPELPKFRVDDFCK